LRQGKKKGKVVVFQNLREGVGKTLGVILEQDIAPLEESDPLNKEGGGKNWARIGKTVTAIGGEGKRRNQISIIIPIAWKRG